MKTLFLFFSMLVFCSCQEPVQPSASAVKSETFRRYVKRFKQLDLPFVYRQVDLKLPANLGELALIHTQTDDSLFIKTEYKTGIRGIGVLPDTSHFFSLIYLLAGDSDFPHLITYNKSGDIISETPLYAGGCAWDCGLKSCSGTVVIGENLSITSTDSLIWEYFCDPSSLPIPNSGALWTSTKSGSISSNGTIRMSPVQQEKKSLDR